MAKTLDVQEFARVKSSIDSLLLDVGKFLGDLVEAPQDQGQAHTLIDEQLQSFFESYYALKRRHEDKSLSVAVLALTKSGKSTLLNSLIAHDCLPVNNVPETARICKIVHSSASVYPEPVMREGDLLHNGAEAVRQRLQEINQEVRARDHLLADERMLQIYAPLAALEQFAPEEASSTKLYLLDTPGPNEAGEEALRHQVERLLMGVDAVIYLLDYTKLKTAEEAEIFRRLRTINPLLVQRLAQRLFFVVNKADQVAEAEGMGADETREYVANLVTQQLGTEGFHLKPEQVLLVSARDALLARLVMANRAGPEVSKRFQRVAFGPRAKPASREENLAAAAAMLQDSGVCELEDRILAFLYANSAAVKLLATIDDIVRLLQELWNVAASCQSALQQDVATLQQQADALRGELQTTLNDFESILKDTDGLQGKVVSEIQSSLEQLRGRLATHILTALEEAEREGAAAQPQQQQARRARGRWARIRQNFLATFKLARAQRESKREDLQARLTELHNEVMVQIQEEVAEFWHDLEGSANSRHRQLVAFINRTLDMVTRRIEASVGECLQVRLEPVTIRLELPSAEQFHSDLEDLIRNGIAEKQERHIRINQQEYQERVLRHRSNGLCRWGSYWANVPRTRTVVETYNSTVYSLQPDEVRRHFLELVYSAVDATQGAVASYVHQFMAAQLEEARAKIQLYSDRYLNTMIGALDTSNRGFTHRASALEEVARHIERVSSMRASVAELQAEVERHVPSSCGPHGYEEVLYDDGFSETSLDQFMEDLATGAVLQSPTLVPAAPGSAALRELPLAESASDPEAHEVPPQEEKEELHEVPPQEEREEEDQGWVHEEAPAAEHVPELAAAAVPVAAAAPVQELPAAPVTVVTDSTAEEVPPFAAAVAPFAAAAHAEAPDAEDDMVTDMVSDSDDAKDVVKEAVNAPVDADRTQQNPTNDVSDDVTEDPDRLAAAVMVAFDKYVASLKAGVAADTARAESDLADADGVFVDAEEQLEEAPAAAALPQEEVVGKAAKEDGADLAAVADQDLPGSSGAAVAAAAAGVDGKVPVSKTQQDAERVKDDGDFANVSVEADEIPAGPFDYNSGFARAMSANGVAQPEPPRRVPSQGSGDEWTLVDNDK